MVLLKAGFEAFLPLDENGKQGAPSNPAQLQSLRMCLVSLPGPNRNSAWSANSQQGDAINSALIKILATLALEE